MKRFSETDKWKDEWFSSLSILQKLVFLFLIDNCDNAGFFEINARLNSFLIGILESEYLGALNGLSKGLVKSKDEKKYFIKNFLFHQKNLPLKYENNAHKQIIFLIENNKMLFDYDFEKLGANEGLISPIGKGKGKGNGLGKDLILSTTEKEVFENLKTELLNSDVWISDNARILKYSIETITAQLNKFADELFLKDDFYKPVNEYKKYFVNWLKKQQGIKDPSKPKMVY